MNKVFMLFLTFVLTCLCFYSCGEKEDSESNSIHPSTSSVGDNYVESSTINHENAVSESTTVENNISTEIETTTEPVLMTIADAREFNSGVAWVNSGTEWCIVDTEGNIVHTFPNNYTIVTDFKNGYSIIDPKATTYMNGRIETSNESVIIDTKGEIVLDLQANGYSSIANYDGLADGSIILVKNLDTFEKSGDFLCHYDLNNGIEKEACPLKENYKWNTLIYMGNDYYVRYLDLGNSASNQLPDEILCFHNYMTDETLSFRDEGVITNVLGSNEYSDWTVNKVGDFIFASVEVKDHSMRAKGFIFDLTNKVCKSVPINDFAQGEVVIGDGYYGDYSVDDIWGNLANIQDGYPVFENYFYDFTSEKYTPFSPKCDYECEIADYSNGFFLATTKNENNNVFFTVIDWDMNPLFSPKRYSDTTSIIDNYLLNNEENGTVSITQLPNTTPTKTLDNSTITYVDNKNKYVWVTNDNNSTECYDIESNELILQIDGIFDVLSNINDGLVLVKNSETNQYMYIDMEGEELEIIDVANETTETTENITT